MEKHKQSLAQRREAALLHCRVNTKGRASDEHAFLTRNRCNELSRYTARDGYCERFPRTVLSADGPLPAHGDPRPVRSFPHRKKRERVISPVAGAPTVEQREVAEQTLRKAQMALLQRGIAPESLRVLLRVGAPADEIVKAARDLQVDCIVIGSRGNALGQRLRRVLVGSTSRRVLRLAPCPVMVVSPLQLDRSCDLVAWYEEAVKRVLEEHPNTFTILTQTEVAHLFVPLTTKVVGRRELGAASRALEHLVSSGVLFRYDVKGETRYIND